MRRKRRHTSQDEYQDPLKNYDPPTYADETEQTLCEAKVADLQITPLIAVDVSSTVAQAIRLMAEKDIASVMVVDGEKLVGIFSTRDVLLKVAEQYEQLKDKSISEVMTNKLVRVYDGDSPAKALNLMAVGGFRHLPVVNLEEKLVGMLGPRRLSAYLCRHFGSA